jgi:hypothetical protein
MVRQWDAQQLCDKKLKEYGLYQKGWRTVFTKSEKYIGRCWHDVKRIELSLIHLNSRSEADLMDTIIHEIAHAICGQKEAHGPDWENQCKLMGLSNPKACGEYVNPDNGRAITASEMKPKRQFHRLNVTCHCGRTAKAKSTIVMGGAKWTLLECGHLTKLEQLGSNVNYRLVSESGKEIFPYQIEGIKFLEDAGGRALIADEPALGKTIQASAFCALHKQETCPVLWVCRGTLKLQTLKEWLDWFGPEFMGQIIEKPRSFIIPNLKLYIISMDLLRNMPTEKIEKIGFKTVVADEIQNFKNPDSTRTAELRKLVSKAEYFIPLSGTPWKNRGQEYFPVLNMLDPVRFPSYEQFKDRWVRYYYDDKSGKYRQGGINNIPAFREFTKDIVIRRMRDDVLPDLPKVNRTIRFIDMEDLYKEAYDKMEEKMAHQIKAAMIDGMPLKMVGQMIMQLKHVTGLAKVQTTIEDVIEFLENTEDFEKIILFHHHIDVGNNLQHGDAGGTYKGLDTWLKENGYNPSLRLFGGADPDTRFKIETAFKNDIRNRILIASTLASGEGLNLQFCQNIIMMERQWNPQNEEQAEFRVSRPLTKNDLPEYLWHLVDRKIAINCPYMIADGTVDTILTEIVERKRHEFKRSMNVKDEHIQWNENDIIREVAEYIVKKRFKNAKELISTK